MGSSEDDEEYRLIIQANSMTAEIDNEMQTIHKVNQSTVYTILFLTPSYLLIVY